MGNAVYTFPETLDPVPDRVFAFIFCLVSRCNGNGNVNRKWSVIHALTPTPSCWSARTQTQPHTDTHTHTQLVFLSLMTLAGLRRRCMFSQPLIPTFSSIQASVHLIFPFHPFKTFHLLLYSFLSLWSHDRCMPEADVSFQHIFGCVASFLTWFWIDHLLISL